jgi:hypothetical protein
MANGQPAVTLVICVSRARTSLPRLTAFGQRCRNCERRFSQAINLTVVLIGPRRFAPLCGMSRKR